MLTFIISYLNAFFIHFKQPSGASKPTACSLYCLCICNESIFEKKNKLNECNLQSSDVCVHRSLKRDNPHLSEDVVLIRALRDSNLPKFLTDDAVLFG